MWYPSPVRRTARLSEARRSRAGERVVLLPRRKGCRPHVSNEHPISNVLSRSWPTPGSAPNDRSNNSAPRREFKGDLIAFKNEIHRDPRDMHRRSGDLANRPGTLVEDIVAPNIPGVPGTLRLTNRTFSW
jgi:hypothetical protein